MPDTFKINAKPFATALAKTLPAVERRNSIPIFGHTLWTVTEGAVKFCGTNLDERIEATAPADTRQAFSLAVDPRPILQLLRHLGDEVLTVTFDGYAVLLEWSDGRAAFPTMAAADFPPEKATSDGVSAELPPTFVSECLDPIMHCISTEETRYYLNGVCFAPTKKGSFAVATDGHRLAARPAPALDALLAAFERAPILPHSFVRLLAAHGRGKHISLTLYGNRFTEFRVDGLRVSGKLIDGSYPDWRHVVPTDMTEKLVVTKAGLLMALARVQIVSGTDTKSVRIECRPEGVRLSARGFGSAVAESAVGPFQGGFDHVVGFNGRYVAEAVKTIPGDMIQFAGKSAADPFVATAPGDESGAINILMPLHIDEKPFELPARPPERRAA